MSGKKKIVSCSIDENKTPQLKKDDANADVGKTIPSKAININNSCANISLKTSPSPSPENYKNIEIEKNIFVIEKEDILKYGTPESELIASLFERFSNQYGYKISLNELGTIYGERTMFYATLSRQTYFLERTVEKLERLVCAELMGDNLAKGLDSINKYRRIKNYVIFDEAKNKPEIILIKSLRTIFEQKTGNELTPWDLGKVIGLPYLIVQAWEERSTFKPVSIEMLEQKISELLDGNLYINALNALDLYREARQYKKLEDLLEDPEYSNYIPELELILILKQNFSEEFDEFVSISFLGKMLMDNKKFFHISLERQSSFSDNTLRAFRKKINEILTGSLRKETLKILNDYEELDKYRKKLSESSINLWKDLEYRSRQEKTRQTEEYLNKRRGSANPRWIEDRTQIDSNGHSIRFRYLRDFQKENLLNQQLGLDGFTGVPFTEYDILHRHHLDGDKSNDDLKNLILLTANTHAMIPKFKNSKWKYYFQMLSENKQDFIDGVAPRNWSKEAKNLFNERQVNKVDLRDFS